MWVLLIMQQCACSATTLPIVQSQGVLDHQVVHISGTLHFQAFCECCHYWSVLNVPESMPMGGGGGVLV